MLEMCWIFLLELPLKQYTLCQYCYILYFSFHYTVLPFVTVGAAVCKKYNQNISLNVFEEIWGNIAVNVYKNMIL